jgi:hypothetical protein
MDNTSNTKEMMSEVKQLPYDINHPIILLARPDSKESSVKVYSGIMNKLSGHFGLANLDKFIVDFKSVENFINGEYHGKNKDKVLQENTKRNYFVVCMIIVEGINGGKYTDKWNQLPEHIFYKVKVDSLNKEFKSKAKVNGGLTNNQKDNITSLSEIHEMLDKIEKVYVNNANKHTTGKNKISIHTLPKKIKQVYTAWILFHMYIELPVRNEIANIIYKRGANYLKSNISIFSNLDLKKNYLIYVPSKNSFTLIRNSFKTSDKYDPIKTELSKELSKKLKKYCDVFEIGQHIDDHGVNDKVFPELMDTDNPELNLTKLLTRVSQEYLQKNISSTLMAKLSISTPELSQAVNVIQQVADTRGTNPGHVVTIYANNNVNQPPPHNT